MYLCTDKIVSEIAPEGLQMMVRTVGNEATASTPIIKLDSKGFLSTEDISPDFENKIFLLAGIEGI